MRTGEQPVAITASIFPPGSTRQIRWEATSPLVSLSAAEGESVTVTAANRTERTQIVPIEVRADNGFVSRAFVTVNPAYRPAPVLTDVPVIMADNARRMRVEYTLGELGERPDQSSVSWFTCADAHCARRKRWPFRAGMSRSGNLLSRPIWPGDTSWRRSNPSTISAARALRGAPAWCKLRLRVRSTAPPQTFAACRTAALPGGGEAIGG